MPTRTTSRPSPREIPAGGSRVGSSQANSATGFTGPDGPRARLRSETKQLWLPSRDSVFLARRARRGMGRGVATMPFSDVSVDRMFGIRDIAGDAIISVDADQKVLFFNRGAERTFGYAAADVV